MGGGPESRCVGRVYGADGAVRVARHRPHCTQDNKRSNVGTTSLWSLRGTIFAVETQRFIFFNVLLTVHLSIFISVLNELDAQNLFHNKFYFMPLHVWNTMCSSQF